MKFNTEGNEKSDELFGTGTDMDNARLAEWSAGEVQDERDKVKQSIQCAVHVHEIGGALNDMQKLEDPTHVENNFQKRRAPMWEHVATTWHEGTAYVCTHCGRQSKQKQTNI